MFRGFALQVRPPETFLIFELIRTGDSSSNATVKWITKFWLFAMLAISPPSVHAAEIRIWTSRQGTTIEAELLKLDGVSVNLLARDSKQISLKFEDLSLGDRQFLVEYGGADRKILTSAAPGEPEKQVRIDPASFKKIKDKGIFIRDDAEPTLELLETDHFLIGSAGDVRDQSVAETAERMWHGMAFQHMNFRRDWGDKRMLLIVCEDRPTYKAVGDWYLKHLNEIGQDNAAEQVAATWDRSGASKILLPDITIKDFNLFPLGQVFNVTDKTQFKKPMSPFQIHCLAGLLLEKQLGNVSSFGAEGYFAVLTGHAFYKEILLGGKSETHLLGAIADSGGDDPFEKRGFEDGTSWARELKSVIRKGEIKVELAPTFSWTLQSLKPAQLVLIYSLSYYMQSTPERLNHFATMIRRIESSKQIPAPIEIARIFGFETVEAFETDWALFIKEGNFK